MQRSKVSSKDSKAPANAGGVDRSTVSGAAAAAAPYVTSIGNVETGWDDVDAKLESTEVKQAKMTAARMVLARMKRGVKPTRVTIPYSFAMSCAAVTGVVNSSQAIYADSNSSEWGAFAALYDEYRVHGGVVKYHLTYFSPTVAGGLNTNSLFLIAYDPTDPNALGSVRDGTELAQHQLVCATSVVGDTSAAAKFAYVVSTGQPHSFKWSANGVKALTISNTGAVTYAAGAWKSVESAGSNVPDGQLKAYGQSDYTTALPCVSGVHYLDVEFRSRK